MSPHHARGSGMPCRSHSHPPAPAIVPKMDPRQQRRGAVFTLVCRGFVSQARVRYPQTTFVMLLPAAGLGTWHLDYFLANTPTPGIYLADCAQPVSHALRLRSARSSQYCPESYFLGLMSTRPTSQIFRQQPRDPTVRFHSRAAD